MSITKKAALDYHAQGRPGKLKIVATKPMDTQVDLSLAYSPGVAHPVLEIADIRILPTTTPPRET